LAGQAADFAEFPVAAYLEEAFLGEAYLVASLAVAYLEEVEALKRRYLPELFAEK